MKGGGGVVNFYADTPCAIGRNIYGPIMQDVKKASFLYVGAHLGITDISSSMAMTLSD